MSGSAQSVGVGYTKREVRFVPKSEQEKEMGWPHQESCPYPTLPPKMILEACSEQRNKGGLKRK